MKVLVVLSEPPLYEGGAQGRCAVGLLRGLRAHQVGVEAVAARQHYALPGLPPADLPVEVVPVAPEVPGWRARLSHLRRPLGQLGTDPFAARVRDRAKGVDVVHLDGAETTWSAGGIRVPSLVHLHYRVRLDRPMGWPWQRAMREAALFALLERAAIRRHRYLLASSPVVAATLRAAAPSAEVVLAPLALDPDDYPPAPLDGPPRAGIVGMAAWPPTRTAIRRLVRHVWPEVRRRVPTASLVIAGRGTNGLGIEGKEHGVEVRGEVPSAREFLRSLSLLLYPLERGSGMKVKVLESVASGLPVVTTPCGAEGIEAGEGMVVALSDADLAAAAAALLVDPTERRERGSAGRRAFLRRYSPLPATEPLVDLYRRMAR